MIAQTVLPFKLEIMDDKITAHAGLAVFGEVVHATGILTEVNKALKGPGSGAGYKPWQYVESMMLMVRGDIGAVCDRGRYGCFCKGCNQGNP